jgi:hypothetical protein
MSSSFEMVDKRLASSDFCHRLHAVSTTNESGTKIWWPALKFDSHKELMNALASDMEGMDGLPVLKARVTVILHQLKQVAGVGVVDKCGVAYLLGRKDVKDALVLLPHNHEGLVGDFFTHYEDMAAGVESLRKAMELVMSRLAEVEVASNEAAVACAPKAEGVKLEECAEKPSHVPDAVTSTAVKPRRSERTIFSLESSGYIPSGKKAKQPVAKKENQKPAAKEAPKKTPAKKSKAANEEKVTAPQFEEIDREETKSPIKVKSVVVNKDSLNISPLKCSQYDGDSSVSVASRLNRYVPLGDKTASWGVVWQDMKDGGWGYKSGDKLVSYYYVHPTFTHLTKAEMLEQCKEGTDYFKSEEALKKYVAKEYGWEGEVNSPLSTMPVDMEIGERIKAKPRVRRTVKRSPQVKHALGSVVKVNQAASKKAAKIRNGSPRVNADVAFEYESEDTSDSGGDGFSKEASIEESVEKNLNGKRLSYGRRLMNSNLKKMQEEDEEPSTPGGSSSDDTSVDSTYRVMKSGDAWTLLMKLFGFSYHNGKYCLPGRENRPGKDSAAKEGVHYFDSIEKLRKNLCAYGLPQPKEDLSEEDQVDIERWVRYAHARTIPQGTLINDKYIDEPMKQSDAWRMLQKLGMKHIGSGYVVPESETSECKKFDRAEEFYEHLARFGIPRIVSDSVLNDDERRQLDLFLFSPGKHMNTL